MTALVTGGCGFIGRHLVGQLRARGDAVRGAFREQDDSLE